jgi:multicomponent Na+:H+ antiporter subunit B
VPEPLVESMMAIGVLIYGGVGVAGLLLGGNYLDYFVLDPNPVLGSTGASSGSRSAWPTTVSGVMLKIFYMFADRSQSDSE